MLDVFLSSSRRTTAIEKKNDEVRQIIDDECEQKRKRERERERERVRKKEKLLYGI
jgi:hypothetical protein